MWRDALVARQWVTRQKVWMDPTGRSLKLDRRKPLEAFDSPAHIALTRLQIHMTELIPIWDACTNRVMLDEQGGEVRLAEHEVRVYISTRRMTVTRSRGGDRRVYWRGAASEVPTRGGKSVTIIRRIPTPTKFCVPEHIGAFRVFKHVAHLCSSSAPDRRPVDARCM